MHRRNLITLGFLLLAAFAWPREGTAGRSPKFGETPYVDQVPVVLSRKEPAYPAIARDALVQGTVLVQALVDRKGKVADTRVTESVPMLDRSAVECVRQWRFQPAMNGGRPVALWVAVPVRFALGRGDGSQPGNRAETPGAGGPGEEANGVVHRSIIGCPIGQSGPVRTGPAWPGGRTAGGSSIELADHAVLDALPEVVRRVDPVAGPAALRDAGPDLLVVVRARVGRDGSVGDVSIARSVRSLDAAALAAVRQWRFRPARRAGRSVGVSVLVPVSFAAP